MTKKVVSSLACLAVFESARFAFAAGIGLGLFNTGVNGSGIVLPNGTTPDPHYSLVSAPAGTASSTLVRTSSGGYPLPPVGPYLGDDSVSAWIGPDSGEQLYGPDGLYDYQTSFTSPVTRTIVLKGQWATDNQGVNIDVDGIPTGNTIPYEYGSGPYSFETWTTFTLIAPVTKGTNSIDFILNNEPYSGDPQNPTALRVEFTSVAIPLPASVWAGLGLIGSIGAFRLVRKQSESAFA
jgi:hypothetical protein